VYIQSEWVCRRTEDCSSLYYPDYYKDKLKILKQIIWILCISNFFYDLKRLVTKNYYSYDFI